MKTAKSKRAILSTPVSTVPTGCAVIQGKIRLTKWTASQPITKKLELTDDDSIRKVSTASQLYAGTVERIECTATEFIKVLNNIGDHDCLSYGMPLDDSAHEVLTKASYLASGKPAGKMTRTADKMVWPTGPAIFMGDYDPDDNKSLSPQQLRETLYQLCPAMRNAAHVWSASTSSCLYKGRNEIRGVKGQRLYFVVADGTDIPRAAKVLEKMAWLAGHGYIKISKSGSLLPRWILDGAVFQTNRIDYCAPAICEPPLVQRKPKPVLYGNVKFALDTHVALPELSGADEAHYEQLLTTAKIAAEPKASIVRRDWQAARVEELVANGVERERAKEVVEQASENGFLLPDFQLTTENGKRLSVGELLADKATWHGVRFADPIEPDYHNDNRIARAYLIGVARPYIQSFAHGGCRYYLTHSNVVVRLQEGQRQRYMGEIVAIFLKNETYFQRAKRLVTSDETGSYDEVTDYQVMAEMDRQFRFQRFIKNEIRHVDATLEMSKYICHGCANLFPRLQATITAPIIVPDTGRLIDKPGYDIGTGVFALLPEDLPAIPSAPSIQDTANALGTLWYPVHMFPFATKVDQTVMLTAILTAVLRPLLPTAPGFAFDAPIQSSGKTLLIKVLATLMGVAPTMSPHSESHGDEETRKRLFSMLLAGSGTIVFDNIVGEFDSGALASMMTSEVYSDRILGTSKIPPVPTNSLVLLSGNNLVLKGELPRRFLRCRIDPQTETPHSRIYAFSPVQVVREYRQEIVAAALTLIMAYRSNKGEEAVAAGGTGSFEVWDSIVRQTVCWLALQQDEGKLPMGTATEGELFPQLCDPSIAINEAVSEDPSRSQLGRLLTAIACAIGTGDTRSTSFTAKDLISRGRMEHPVASISDSGACAGPPRLSDVLMETAAVGTTGIVSAKILGRALTRHKDRICGGLCLRKGEPYQGAATYFVENSVRDFGDFGDSNSADKNKKENNVIPISQTKLTKLTKVISAAITPGAPLSDKKRMKGARG